ncbi:hypothetical protein J6590_070827 [Homalodisca vitripennis]|nr:hypothetical protein J6590_093660 [Homalodisca vitripennis]KAG8276175.1 hypothetical protein J6590_070827 [Homalodisca vitripennis]
MSSCPTLAIEAVLRYTPLGQEVMRTAPLRAMKLLGVKVINTTSLEGRKKIMQEFPEAEMLTNVSEAMVKKYFFEKPYNISIDGREKWIKKEVYPTKAVLKFYTDGSHLDSRAGYGISCKKMAPASKNPVCGACPKKVTNTTGGLMCERKCMKWFHFECVGKSKKEYSYSKGEKSNFLCDNCKKPLQEEQSVCIVNTPPVTVAHNADINSPCDCVVHIQILTDQIFDLTQNLCEIRDQLSIVQVENTKLTSILNDHSEVI